MITVERARELLSYDPETGVLTWKANRPGGKDGRACRIRAGDVAGRVDGRGYVRVMVDYRTYSAHRLAWMIFYGQKPPRLIDHRNSDFSDNSIGNLRAATSQQNNRNRKLGRNSTTGLKGVSFHKSRGYWVASIQLNGRATYLGKFNCPTAAHLAYRKAAKQYFGEFARFE